MSTEEEIPWTGPLRNFVVSIHPRRLDAFRQRLDRWNSHFETWNGTVGKDVPFSVWRNRRRIDRRNRLREGELGCWHSHYRLWRYIVKHEIEMTLICEDDADIRPSPLLAERIERCLGLWKETTPVSHLLYIGNRGVKRTPEAIHCRGPLWRIGKTYQTTYAYILDKAGARLLIREADKAKWRVPVDVFMTTVRATQPLLVEPRLFHVVPERSSTWHSRKPPDQRKNGKSAAQGGRRFVKGCTPRAR